MDISIGPFVLKPESPSFSSFFLKQSQLGLLIFTEAL